MPDNMPMPIPVDAETIRAAIKSALGSSCRPTGEEGEVLKKQLQGHVQLLVPEAEDLAARMTQGDMRRITVHVLVGAAQLLDECADGSPACDVPSLATTARALLALYERPGPLGEPTGADEIAGEIRRRHLVRVPPQGTAPGRPSGC